MADTRSTAALVWLLLVAICGPVACGGGAGQASGPGSATTVTIQTLAPDRREIVRRYSGFTYPWESSGVGFLIAGRVTALPVRLGESVRRGQLIARLASEDYALVKRLADIQAGAIEPNLARVETLVDKKILPPAQYDEVHGRYAAALTQAAQAERQLDYTRLLAPIDGTVYEVRTAVGQVIGPGMPAVVLLDLSKVKLKVGVAQGDLHLFLPGATLPVTIPGLPRPRTGSVHHVDVVGDSKTRTYTVEIAVDNQDRGLRGGMVGHVEVTAERVDGIFVPLHAVRRARDGSGQAVMLAGADRSRASERAVVLGAVVGEEAVVVRGLVAGEELIVRGAAFVNDGDRIRVLP